MEEVMEEKEEMPRHKNTACTKVWRLERTGIF